MKDGVQHQLQRTAARSENRIKADLTAGERGYGLRFDADDRHDKPGAKRYRQHSYKCRKRVLSKAAPDDKKQAYALFHSSV